MSNRSTDVPRRTLIRDLAAHIAGLRRAHPVRVAIDGVDAAGKTTFANELAAAIESLGRRVIRERLDHRFQRNRRLTSDGVQGKPSPAARLLRA
jgi:hypothetical protein